MGVLYVAETALLKERQIYCFLAPVEGLMFKPTPNPCRQLRGYWNSAEVEKRLIRVDQGLCDNNT